MLNVMSSNGWHEKSLWRSHNYWPVLYIILPFDPCPKNFGLVQIFLTPLWPPFVPPPWWFVCGRTPPIFMVKLQMTCILYILFLFILLRSTVEKKSKNFLFYFINTASSKNGLKKYKPWYVIRFGDVFFSRNGKRNAELYYR